MPEAVIVAAARTPIGRAFKGSLRDQRPDDLAATAIRAALDDVPELDPTTIDDLLLGCGAPGGEQGFNMARVVATLLGLNTVPGATVTRYCASSVQTTRMAMHAIRAGEGNTFISAGVETVSRSRRGTSDNPPVDPDADPRDKSNNPWRNSDFRAAQDRTRARSSEGAPTWTDPWADGHLPDIYIGMGQTAENVAQISKVSRHDQDEFAVRSQNLTERAIESGFWGGEITPVTSADGTRVTADPGPGSPTTPWRVSAPSSDPMAR